MQAVVFHQYGPPEVLKLEEVPQPVPQANEVLIRIRAAALSSADCATRAGDPFIARLAAGISAPKQPILGTEFAGVIEAVGSAVTRFRPGDAIYAASGLNFGAHAEYICLPEDGALAIKPANVTFEQAAAICEGALTALPFLRDAGKIQRGQTVLINGASGSVGAAAVQLAKHFGAEVTGVCSTANVELVKSLGADHVVDYKQADFTQSGQTYDIIFDAVGKSSFSRCAGALNKGGVYLTTVPSFGILWHAPWTALFGSKKAKIALTGLRKPDAKAMDLDMIRGLVEAGKLKPVIDRCYPLEQAAQAHAYVDTGRKKGNVILTMGSPV
jgi:NADPH:quinone reductase-like Zn-dependent oxidoreductase